MLATHGLLRMLVPMHKGKRLSSEADLKEKEAFFWVVVEHSLRLLVAAATK